MRFLIIAALATNLAGSADASPAIPWTNDANQLCVSENFQRTMKLLDGSHELAAQIQSQSEKPVPSWPKLRKLLVKLRQNDILFRQESYRVELKCLDRISNQDRISSLKREFRKIEPPPIIQKADSK